MVHGRHDVKNAGPHWLMGSRPSPLVWHARSSVVMFEMPTSLPSHSSLPAPNPPHPPLLAFIPLPGDLLSANSRQIRDVTVVKVTEQQGRIVPASTSPSSWRAQQTCWKFLCENKENQMQRFPGL